VGVGTARLKIIFLGLTISSSWGNGHATPCRAILRALHALGHQVAFYEKEVDYYARRRDFSSCSYCRLALYRDWTEIRAQALPDIASCDVVIVTSYCPEGARIADEVLQLQGPLRVFYDLDTPITLQNLRNGSLDYLRAGQIPGFDLYLSFTGGPILGELEQTWGARRARALFGCVDPSVYRNVPSRQEFQCQLSYMGTYSADRQDKVEALFLQPARSLPQSQFLLAGSMYPELAWPPNVRVLEHIAPADHPALYSSSRLTLNLTRGGMARYGFCPSGRFFEAAACGAPLVSDWFPGLESFFLPGEELFLVHNAREVLEAIAASGEELSRIAARARQRTLDEHSGERRARQLLAFCEEAQGGIQGSGASADSTNTLPDLPNPSDRDPAADPSHLSGGAS
jgi:spore maturation protein CgeB